MPTLPELLAQHTLVNEKYAKLFAANQAIAKRLEAERKARAELRKQLHVVIGPLPVGSLVMTHNGTRFYEIHSTLGDHFYHAATVYQTNGELKREGTQHEYIATRPIECGSVLPVPATHTVYLKWHKRRLRDKLEGKEV